MSKLGILSAVVMGFTSVGILAHALEGASATGAVNATLAPTITIESWSGKADGIATQDKPVATISQVIPKMFAAYVAASDGPSSVIALGRHLPAETTSQWRLLNLRTGKLGNAVSIGASMRLDELWISNDGTVATDAAEGNIYDMLSGKKLGSVPSFAKVLGFAHENGLLLYENKHLKPTVSLIEPASGKVLREMPSPSLDGMGIVTAISGGGRQLAVVAAEFKGTRLSMIDLETGQTTGRETLKFPKSAGAQMNPFALTFSSDGKHLAALFAPMIGEAQLLEWDTETGKLEKQVAGLDIKPEPFTMKRFRFLEFDRASASVRYMKKVIDLSTGQIKTIPETWRQQPVVWQFLCSESQAVVIGGGNGKDQGVFVQTVKLGT